MERRKFLIGAGTLGAGASVALGTGAFTTVEAQRNVDIGTAGDANAQLAIQALNGANANDLISTEEGDETLSLSIPDVNQDAVTKVEDLFRIVNQGTQKVSLFFEDDSDAVKFRVSRETQSLEGAKNSIQLGVGSQVVVGLTIDTLNNDVSGTLLDRVTIVADASASAPEQSGPQPQYVVDGTGNSPNTFETLSDVLSNDIDEGALIGIEGGVTIDESNVNIDIPGVTIAGVGLGPAQINLGGSTLTASKDDITLRNLTITTDDSSSKTIGLNGDNAIADGLIINKRDTPTNPNTAGPHITASGGNVTITDCDLQGSPISLRGSGSATVTNNSISDTLSEGIFAFTTNGLNRVDITNNLVKNHNTGGGKPSEIKIDESGIAVNGVSSSNPDNQRIALLQDNDVNTVLVKDQQSKILGTKVSSQLSFFSSIQEAVDTAGSKGLTLVESGTFGSVDLTDLNGFTLQGTPTGTAKIDGINAKADDITVEKLTFDGKASSGRTINAPRAKNLTIRDAVFNGSSDAKYAVYAQGYKGDFTFENNEISDYPSNNGFASVYIANQDGGLQTATVTGNDLTRNDGGIEVFGPESVDMKDNSLNRNNAATGALSTADANDVDIEDNKIQKTNEDKNPNTPRSGAGISVKDSSGVTIRNNEILDNVIGVFVRNSDLTSDITEDNTLSSNGTPTDIE